MSIIRTVERYPMAVEVKIDYKRGPNETGEKQAREHITWAKPYGHDTGETNCQRNRNPPSPQIPHDCHATKSERI